MAKKLQNTEQAAATVKAADGAAKTVVEPAEGVAKTVVEPVEVRPAQDLAKDDRLFALYLARISTVDRYRVPITDKGFVAACGKAFDEAKVALSVYKNKQNQAE